MGGWVGGCGGGVSGALGGEDRQWVGGQVGVRGEEGVGWGARFVGLRFRVRFRVRFGVAAGCGCGSCEVWIMAVRGGSWLCVGAMQA